MPVKIIRNKITAIPYIGSLARKIYSVLSPRPPFTTSGEYWEERYCKGGNSGAGSYNELAEFKAGIINAFVHDHGIGTAIEFGCGDGNQLGYLQLKNYTGYDVSPTAIAICKERYKADPTKTFRLLEDVPDEKAELTLSLDVIYHLVEDEAYDDHMKRLFSSSYRYVIIYSSDLTGHENDGTGPHIRHRRFSEWIQKNAPDFKLLRHIPNRHPFDGDEALTSVSDFYIYIKQT